MFFSFKFLIFDFNFPLCVSFRLFIHTRGAMDIILLHPRVLVYMLRPKRMVFPEYHTHAQQQHRRA